MSRNLLFWLVSGSIFILAIFLKYYDLDLRTYHHDEGVNYHFIKQTEQKGYYPYSYLNYHGPSFFYLTYAFYKLYGAGEAALRSSPVFASLLLVLSPLLFRSLLGNMGTLLCQFFFAFTTSLHFFSRYLIHETLFILFSFLLGMATFAHLQTRRRSYVYIAIISLGFLIATKETFIITGFVLLLSALLVFNLKFFKNISWLDFGIAVMISIQVVVLLYTGMLAWMDGLNEVYAAIPQWMGRNHSDTGHQKVWSYYLGIFWGSAWLDQLKLFFSDTFLSSLNFQPYASVPKALELPLFFSILLSFPILIWTMVKAELRNTAYTKLIQYSFLWFAGMLIIYSFPIKYKTPWLIVNLTMPGYLLLSVCLGFLYARKQIIFKILSISLAILSIWLVVSRINYFHHQNYDGPNNPLAYVHTNDQIRTLIKKVLAYEFYPGGKKRVLVASGAYWPLPYYFRDSGLKFAYTRGPLKVTKEGNSKKEEMTCSENMSYGVIILNHFAKFDCPGWKEEYYRLGEHAEVRVYYNYTNLLTTFQQNTSLSSVTG